MKRSLLIAFMFLVSLSIGFAQTIKVQGTVIDKSFDEPVMGASILEIGTTNGTVTDFDGNFELTVQKGATLQISYIGYVTQKLEATEKMEIFLSEDSQMLEEFVVTGYTAQRKADLTGSVAVVSTKALKTSSDTDPMRALQGKVAGMTVPSNGFPSGAGTVRIRGIGSFNSSRDPLYVIDGVPTTSNLNTLNMNDIESMQVLKDAASASIYGSRAANGVIIITTKQGKKGDGKVKIDFNAGLTAQFYTGQTMMKLLDTKGYATAMVQAALNDGIDPAIYAQNYGLSLSAAGGTPIKAYNPATGSYENYTVGGYYDGYINLKRTMRYSDTDWLDVISQTGITQNYDLSMSHASEKGSQMFSLGYKKAEGILKYTDFESFSARMNSTYNINKVVSVGENFTLTYSDQVDCAPMENALKMAPTVPLYEEDGVTFGGPVGGMSDRQNPAREQYFNRDNRLQIWRTFGNAYVDIKPIKGLTLRSNFGLDFHTSYIHSVTYTFHSDVVNNSTPKASAGTSNDLRWTWSNTANYMVPLPEDHTLSALAGIELHRQIYQGLDGNAEGFAVENYNYMQVGAGTGVQKVGGGRDGYALASFFGKLDYNWQDLLLASFTIRRDGSSRFGENNKYGTFPAASLGYRLSKNLDFDVLSDLKVRASWGKTGNQEISNIARFGIYVADYGNNRDTGTAYDFDGNGSGTFPSGYHQTQQANRNLKWETTIQYNAGIDYGFFDNALYGTVDAYIKDIEDMLISPAYLGSLGEGGASWSNGPSLRNWGMEFTLGYRGTTKFGLGYNINGNLDFYRNWVTYLPNTATGSYAHTTKENLVQAKVPYGSRTGFVVEGLFQSKEEVYAYGQENARVGGLKFADLDGNGIINNDDQTWILNPVPNFSYGLNVELNYKNFDVAMFWQGVQGQQIYNDQKYQTDFWSITDAGSNKGSNMLKAWTLDNTSSKIPALTTNNSAAEDRASSYYVEDGSWLKLRSLQFGYTLPENILKKANVSSCRFYVSGQNLLTLKSSSYTVSDPENASWAYPQTTSFSVGVQLGF